MNSWRTNLCQIDVVFPPVTNFLVFGVHRYRFVFIFSFTENTKSKTSTMCTCFPRYIGVVGSGCWLVLPPVVGASERLDPQLAPRLVNAAGARDAPCAGSGRAPCNEQSGCSGKYK